MAQNYIAAFLERSGKVGILVCREFQFFDLLQDIRRNRRTEIFLQLLKSLRTRIAFRSRECFVESDYARPGGVQPRDQSCIVASRKREGVDFLQRSFVDTDNDYPWVMKACSTQTESGIQRALFNILKENKACAIVAIDPGKNKKCKSGQRNEEG